ncbi:MAG: SCP2 sterol-binding domain-containing protein [Myxococcales bacterium]|nr:SCP2 sterol-binding domain-containing protein [Myxococcales bacterium]
MAEGGLIVVTPGAEANGLAAMVADLVRQNLAAHPDRLADLARLDLWLGLRAPDIEVELTLVFAGGRLTVVDGVLPRAEATVTATSEAVLELSLLRVGRSGLPIVWDAAGRKVLRRLVSGELRLRGLGAAGRLLRVVRLLSAAA